MRLTPGVAVQYLLPQTLSCRIVYRLSRSERPWLKNLLIRFFLRLYDVDLDEAETQDALAYPSFNTFFTRALRPGARPLAGAADTLVSPVDGQLTEYGRIHGDTLLQAKGMPYTLGTLLVEQPDLLAPFTGGSYMTIYLAPHNYHRVHTPIAGQLDRGRYVPGRRFAVNRRTAAAIDGVFTRNERVALWLSTEVGYAVVVMIGALNVASISTVATGEIASGPERLFAPEPPGRLARGDELGCFNLGSTVVILFPAGAVEWSDALVSGQSIRMGEAIGRIVGRGA